MIVSSLRSIFQKVYREKLHSTSVETANDGFNHPPTGLLLRRNRVSYLPCVFGSFEDSQKYASSTQALSGQNRIRGG